MRATKILLPHQKELLLNAGLQLVEYDAIKIEQVSFEGPINIEYAIVSSKNAVQSLLLKEIQVKNFYCVGSKTKALLEENGQNVLKMTENSKELGDFIQKSHNNGKIYFFCGNRRRDELPSILKAAKIPFEEIITYKTHLNPKSFHRSFDAILFFSPSGVESFALVNRWDDSWSICVGATTAAAVPPLNNLIAIANAPTGESVIAKTVKTLIKND